MGKRSDKHTIEGVSNREKLTKNFPLGKVAFLIALVFSLAIPFTPIGGKVLDKLASKLSGDATVKVKERIVYRDVIGDQITVTIASPTEGNRLVESHDVASEKFETFTTLSGNSNIMLETVVEPEQSTALASYDRKQRESYKIEYAVKFKIPAPAKTLEELEQMSPILSTAFPGLETMMSSSTVSPYFYQLYKNKTERIKRDAADLNKLLSRHNFFDLQTILNLTSESGRKVTIIQADMDVVSDGSDGDRLPEMPEEIVNSSYYQLSTSYFWKKQTEVPNPMIKGVKKRIGNATEELALAETSTSRRNWLRDRIKWLETKLEDMKHFSYLIAEYDPFIVIPVNMLTDRDDPFAPKAGDYAVVICRGKLYPCIVGDGGPEFKMGEASLRMAKEINENAGIYSRPVSDLSVTYMVFPNSRDAEKKPPSYDEWRNKCKELLDEIGGLSEGYQLHQWENTLP